MQWLLFSLLLTAAHSVSSASIEHVIPRAADTTTQTHEAPEADCTEKATLFIKLLDNYLAMWEKEKGVNRTDAIPHLFWFDLAADVPAVLLPELSVFAPLLKDFSVFTQLLEYRWMDRWGSTSLSLEEVVCNALENNASIRESSPAVTTEAPPETCLEKAKVYLEYVKEYYAKWENWKRASKVDSSSLCFWDDFFAEAPLKHPVELQGVFTRLMEDRWMNPVEWQKVSLEQRLCVILEHTTPSTTTTTVSATKTEPPSMCLIRTKAYIRYFDMFEHYEAWQRYKWVHVYGFIGEYAGIEDYLWDDFLADAPYDHPGFGDLMALLRNLFKNKDRALWDDDRLAEILCEEHTSLAEDGWSELFDEIDEYAYHYLGYYDYYQGHDVFDDDPF